MAADEREAAGARYDGFADSYEGWANSDGAPAMAVARAALLELLPAGPGVAVDVGCGTGLQADAVQGRGFLVLGVDVSADQLRLARDRLPVVRGDAAALPLRSGSARLVFSVLTHTDLDCFPGLVDEAVRVLAPGGAFVYVGVHPCFVHPFAEATADGVRLHEGYRRVGWQPTTPATGRAVRARVGVHHLPLEDFFTALLRGQAPIDRVVERGQGAVPSVIGVRMVRRG